MFKKIVKYYLLIAWLLLAMQDYIRLQKMY